MNSKAGAWLKKGLIAGIGGATLALVVLGASTASADDGKYCVTKNLAGKCTVYGTQPVTWGGAGGPAANSFVAAAEAPITVEPGYYDYLLTNKYYPYYYYGTGYYPYANAPYYNGYYSNITVSAANLPAPVYVVVAAAADAMGVDRGYVYAHLVAGESLDQITDRVGINNVSFLNNFYTQLDTRIAEARANGTMQEWQATALRNNVRNSWFITTQYLLNSLAQYN